MECATAASDGVYLVDTNILSASAPTKAVAQTPVIHWMDRNSASLFLSVITVAEIEDGIARSRRHGATQKAQRLSDWLNALLHLYASRILPIDLPIARHIGALADMARGQGQSPGLADLSIAATAAIHGHTILTRNLRHFTPLGVPATDPFTQLPASA